MQNRTRAEKQKKHLEVILNYLPADKHDQIRRWFFDLKVSEEDFHALFCFDYYWQFATLYT